MNEQQLTDEEQLAEDIAGFEFDPLGHVMYCYPWGVAGTELAKKKGPRRWQKKVLNRIGRKLEEGGELGAVIREAVASGHGIGKSALVAWIIRWALDTFEDTKGVVTANTGAQLKTKTWAELAKWHRLSITSHWFERTATGIYSTDPDHKDTWRIDAIPWSKENSEAFAGLHNEGKRIIVIFDEASAIDDIIWEVTEGALTDDLTQIIWLCFGNPTRSTGRFRECFRRFRRLWGHEQVDSRTVEGVNTKQADEWIETYGEDSDFVKIRVRGIFPNVSARQFISEEAVRTAQSRHLRKEQYDFAPRILTLDNAWEGDDLAVIGFRQGLFFKVLAKYPKNDNDIEIANALAAFEDEYEADAVFIDAGYGTGVVSAGRTMGRNWTLVWFGGKSSDLGCFNKRAEMWNEGKKWLAAGGVLPPDEEIFYDLIGPETVPRIDGMIQLESKKDMKGRGLPSPNYGDAWALSFAFPVVKRDRVPQGKTRPRDQVQCNWKPM